MQEICVVSVSWRHGNEQDLERFTLPREGRPQRLAALRREVEARELVYLATCNRVEFVLLGHDGIGPDEYRQRVHRAMTADGSRVEAMRRLRAYDGEGAVEHLFLVAAGLDSAQIGEKEISGQLRRAIDEAQQAETLGPGLRWVLDQAARAAKAVQSRSAIGSGRVSIAEVALDAVRAHLQQLPGPVALVGIGEMTRRAAAGLHAAGIELIIVNRSVAAAEALASTCHGRAIDLDAFRQHPPAITALVSATGASETLFDADALRRLQANAPAAGPLLIDLAIPADIDPNAAERLSLRRIGMTEISASAQSNRERREAAGAEARAIVDEAVAGFRRRTAQRAVSPISAGLQECYRRTAREGMERLLDDGLADLDHSQRENPAQLGRSVGPTDGSPTDGRTSRPRR